ncbi:hypothetical protein [Aeoliella sp.]|uniref:hypothetical protein n=1 Tax=Aeoliella sp. TaxID=2795800 RepID=UPI003CCB7CC8
MPRLYPQIAKLSRPYFEKGLAKCVAELDRDEAERLLRQHLPSVAATLIATWPEGEPVRGAAEAALMGIWEELER